MSCTEIPQHFNNIPVLLLTGYLGSGKTTLLNRILSNRKGIRFAVIVNDIGEVNIDAELIQKGGVVAQTDDNLIALQNGCICCSLKMDLIGQLRDICTNTAIETSSTYEISVPRFDYIVIEASGICQPAPIAQTIASYNSLIASSTLSPSPKLDAVVTVVDALRMRDEFLSRLSSTASSPNSLIDPSDDLASLVVEQIEFCNIILLNKVSEVKQEELNHIRALVRAIQPEAEVIDCDYCDVPFGKILDTELFDFEKVATSATWIQKVEGDVEEETFEASKSSNSHGIHHHHHEHGEHCRCHNHEHNHKCDDPNCHCHNHNHNHSDTYGITTFVYYRRSPMDLARFDEFVARHWPKGVIRCKGMCYFDQEYDMCYLFEQAGSQFSLKQAGHFYATMPEEELLQLMASDLTLQRDWDERYGDRMQKLVFIGQHIDKHKICQLLDNCLLDK
ncbi:MAG: GTP-binding protein [Paludibacteraceae bacterium]|nr:GTP-binding protein [Paludibacteraceae bacterium]